MIAENLAIKLLHRLGLFQPASLPYDVFEAQRERCESPMEVAFWNAGYFELSKLGDFAPQMTVGPYRIDFTLTGIPETRFLKVAIEIDGHEGHKTKEQRNHDTERERYLQRHNWKVIRFTGSQVYRDAGACVIEARDLIKHWIFYEGYRR
jgi:very-short-patch-repair endonuclease